MEVNIRPLAGFPRRVIVLMASFAASLWLASSSFVPQRVEAADRSLVEQNEFVASIRDNASLNDLAIVSEKHIVSVGDRGLILVTDNGGRSWRSIESPTTDNLYGVAIDVSGVGVAVGGQVGPHTHRSQATVLRTTDSGETWEAITTIGLSRLVGVNLSGGVFTVWGDLSTAFKTGVFQSTDGGQFWRPLQVPLGHVVASGGFEAGGFAAVDRLGGAVMRLGQSNSNAITDFSRPLSAIHHTGTMWLAAGASGELLSSKNGTRWRSSSLPLGDEARACMQFEFIAQAGQDVWIGGSPGSVLLRSSDLGQTWEKVSTGQASPVRNVQFYDRERGWAICGYGRILATRDGGKSWYVQRDAPERLGVLAMGRSEPRATWLPMVSSAWDQQCTSGALAIGPFDPVEFANVLPGESTVLQTLASQIGLADYQMFDADEKSIAQRMAIQLLSMRPDVVLVSDETALVEARHLPGLRMVSKIALEAIQFATQADEHYVAVELELKPWKVKKLVTLCREDSQQYSESPHRVLSAPGLAVRDVMASLPEKAFEPEKSVALRTLWSASQSAAATSSLMGAIPPSKQTSLMYPIVELGNYQLIMGRVHRDKVLKRVVAEAQKYSLDGLGSPDAERLWEQQVSLLLKSMPDYEFDSSALRLMRALDNPRLEHYRQLAVNEIIRRGGEADIAVLARWELLSRAGSDERQAWLASIGEFKKGSGIEVRTAGATKALASESPAVWNATPFHDSMKQPAAVQTASHVSGATPYVPQDVPWLQLMAGVIGSDSFIATKPQFSLLRTARTRVGGAPDVATQTLSELASQKGYLGWPQVAAQELLLGTPGQRGRWQATANFASTPPVLDGRLDDACWGNAAGMLLKSADLGKSRPSPTEITWAFDQEYLYFAVSSPVSDAASLPEIVTNREYDSDLTEVDRVEIMLDTDRDYGVAVHLAVSEDGRTFDRCGGNESYNPKWYVAVGRGQDRWTAEVAIPMEELTTVGFMDLNTWAVSARRTTPGQPTQTWSLLRTNQLTPRCAGLLEFVRTAAQ